MLAMLGMSAYAQGGKEDAVYVAAEVGQMSLSDYCDDVASSCEDAEIAFGVSGGYRFHDNWSAEIGYRMASGFDATIPLGIQNVNVQADTEASSISFGIRGTYFVSDRFGLTGKAGVHIWDMETTGSISGVGSVSITDDGTKPYFGGGVQLLLTDNIAIQGEYALYQGDVVDASLFSGGLTWAF